MSSSPVVWKHIGLHGHSVGSFACDGQRIIWKSAVSGRDDNEYATTKSIPAAAVKGALWSVFGKSGHLRIQLKLDKENTKNLEHEFRFDGFPTNDFDLLKDTLKKNYGVDLQQHNLSAAGTQYGLTSIQNKNLVFKHCVLDEMNEEGQEFEPRAEDEMLSLDLAEVSQVRFLRRAVICSFFFTMKVHCLLVSLFRSCRYIVRVAGYQPQRN